MIQYLCRQTLNSLTHSSDVKSYIEQKRNQHSVNKFIDKGSSELTCKLDANYEQIKQQAVARISILFAQDQVYFVMTK